MAYTQEVDQRREMDQNLKRESQDLNQDQTARRTSDATTVKRKVILEDVVLKDKRTMMTDLKVMLQFRVMVMIQLEHF